MRILLVHPHDIYSSAEPWTRRIVSFANEFVKQGHEVKLAYFALSNNNNTKRVSNGYEAIALSRVTSTVVFLKNIFKLQKLAKWADIVHFQKCQYYAAIPAVIAAYIRNKPLHYDWDDWEEMIWYESCGRSLHARFIGFHFKIIERVLPVLADSVSVASQELNNLTLRFGVKENNICTVPVGADLEEFNPGIDGRLIKKRYAIKNPLVLYVGQLCGAQHIDLFIQAAKIVLDKYPQVIFMIVGEGFMEKSLKDLTKQLNIDDKIIFTGSFSHEEIPLYIAAADICVAPFKETRVTVCKSPLKIVEYLACGKPIVASNVGEVRRMIEDAGILVEAGKAGPLADNILSLLLDVRLRDELGKKARKRAEDTYNWKASSTTLLNAYKKDLKQSK